MNTIVALPIVSAVPTAAPAMAALGGAAALPGAAAAPAAGKTVDVLYEERTALAARSRELLAKIKIEAATASLPCVGLPALRDQLDALGERIKTLDQMLGNMPVQIDSIAQKAAAVLLIETTYERDHDDMFNYGATAILEILLPSLRGQVREHAEFVLADVFALMKEMPFWPGELS